MLHGEGKRFIHTYIHWYKRTSRLLYRIGPVGRFGKNEYCDHWSDNTNLILWHFVVCLFFTKKIVKIMTILGKIFNKWTININWYLFSFDTTMTHFPCKVRHVLPRRDVCHSVIAKYLHIHIPNQNLKKVWIGGGPIRNTPALVHAKQIAWKGDNKQTTHGRTSRLLDRIGPVGGFGENHITFSALNEITYLSPSSFWRRGLTSNSTENF